MIRNRFLALLTAFCLLLSALPIHTHASGVDPVETLYHNRNRWEATHQIQTDSRGQRIVSPKGQGVLPSGDNDFLVSDTLGTNCQWAIAADGFLYIWCEGDMPVCQAGQYPWGAYTGLYNSAYVDAGSVADYAFADHDNLQVVILEGSVAAIGQYAFADCDNMEDIWFYGTAPSIAANALTDTVTYLVYHITDDSFEPLVDQSFGGTVHWAVWVNTLASGMFGTVEWQLNEDMSLYLHGSFGPMQDRANAGDYPWSSWSQQVTYVSCSQITHLGSYALADFTALVTVDFDETLISLGNGAFRNCDGFTLCFSGNAPTLGDEVFTTDDFGLEYPQGNTTWTQRVVNLFYGITQGENELPRDEEGLEPEAVTCGTPAQQIYDAMIAMKAQYPEGMPWTNDDGYAWNGGYFTMGYGCAAFAFILSDAAFGYLPSRQITTDITIEDIRVGDILRINNDTHSVIVLEVHDDHVVIAEGNFNSSIHWGRTLSAQTIASTTDYIMTRYPEHNWSAGSCLDPRTCASCGTHEGAPGHSWIAASCTAPKTCAVCGFTEDAPIGHVYDDEHDNTCNVCGFQRETVDNPPIETPVLLSAYELEVLRLTNQIRLEHGLNPLTSTTALQQATDIRANEIQTSFEHTRPDGTSCFTVLQQVGISYRSAAENIAYGYRTPAEVMEGWMNSPGHRGNILTPELGHMGVGEANRSWVQLFTDAPAYTSIRVDIPADLVIQPGTSIDDLGLVAVLHNRNGDCWLPVSAAYCSGYDPNAGGTQTVSVAVLGVTCTFTLTSESHTHSWVDATCETSKTCSECGKAEGAPLGHTWVAATCEAPKTCSICGKTDGAPLDHTWVDATCEAPKTCSVCGKTDGAPLDHTWVDATCEAPKTCSVCGKTDGAPLNHTWVDATCEAPKSCSVCGKTDGAPLGHNWTAATCEATKTCSVCGKTDGSALGHTWMDATCETPKTCSVCGKTDGAPLNHTWVAATCEAPKTCSVCSKTDGAALDHTWVAATCEAPKTCSVCGKTDDAALGHDWAGASCEEPNYCNRCGIFSGEAVGHTWKDATCQAPRTCTVCGFTSGEPNPHMWENATCAKPQTCKDCGLTAGEPLPHTWTDATCVSPKTCAACGVTEGEPLAHRWENATCLTPQKCSDCGAAEGEPLPHAWQPADCLTPSTCANCHQTQGEPLGHEWTDATCQLPKTCVRCGATEGLSVPHSFQDGYCTVCHAPECVMGDASGDGMVTYDDALRVLRASIELEVLTPEAAQACDVDGNGRLDYNDALLILRFSIGLITEFPRKN